MEKFGLVDILNENSTIIKDVRYATTNNFTGKILYKENFGLFAVPSLAEAILNVNEYLRSLLPGYHIVIFDAARPYSIQKEMFEIVKGTSWEPYIANPYGQKTGGFHNYGLAVDMSIADANGHLLDMGTEYDAFNPSAHSFNERILVTEGKITKEAYSNRMLLYMITGKYGLYPHPFEWWHFQWDYDENTKGLYPLLDF